MQEKRWLEISMAIGSDMVGAISTPQERILRWLGRSSPAMEKAWDVNRDLSVPGISEALGVVRSALNIPLNVLEEQGLIFKRKAHVIGGGSRRRHVYHLTEDGRQKLESLGETKQKKKSSRGTSFGTLPILGQIHGRQHLAAEVSEQVLEQHCLALSGLPGIGKTTIGGLVSEHLLESGANVRWARVGEFTDLHGLCEQWGFKAPLPKSNQALVEYAGEKCKGEMLVIDDAHLISERHIDSIRSFCSQLSQKQASHMLLIGREPMPFSEAFPRMAIPSLEVQDAALLLGDTLAEDERLRIAERLGGHPLAILLHEDGIPLPEAGADVQSYVENVVLSTLDDSTRTGLDHIVMAPMPIEASKAFDSDVVGILDDYALLRWTSNLEKMEIQHLVRNVRRSALDYEATQRLHQAAVTHWETLAETADDHIILLYHRIASLEEGIDAQLDLEMERLVETHSGAFSVLLEQAIKASPKPSHLHYLAGKVAIERCEPEHARRHLESIEDLAESRQVAFGLAMLDGRVEQAEEIIEAGLSSEVQSETNRMAIAAAARRLDDRIHNQTDTTLSGDVKHYLSKVKLPQDAPEERSVTLVAMSMIQHALALQEEDFEKAQRLRTSLAGIGGLAQPLLQSMAAKATLLKAKSDLEVAQGLEEMHLAIEAQTNSIRADALRLALVEYLQENDAVKAKEIFDTIDTPKRSANNATLHRLNARWWTCKSYLQSSMRRVALREAITQHRAAGCPRAAKTLEAQLHSLL
jgi:DNA-binding MarR family transcriptional regulator|tara:strand:+ start:14716 stop:16974 length:2259 start_codon:yes stop_codon:yes gene_type:complete